MEVLLMSKISCGSGQLDEGCADMGTWARPGGYRGRMS